MTWRQVEEHAFEIVVDLPVEGFFRHFGSAARRRTADIVDQNVDAAEFLAAGLGHGADLRVVQHIADMSGDLAVIADARDRLGHRVGVLVDGKDLGALAREQHRGGAAIAPAGPDTARPDDQRDFSLDTPRHDAFPCSFRRC